MPPWDRLPRPFVSAALWTWGHVPRRAQVAFGTLFRPALIRLFGGEVSAVRLPGPSIVPGVDQLIAAGFTPVEDCTGFLSIWRAWPEEHRRSVPETREWWLDDAASTDGRVWLVRSPWPRIELRQVFNLTWDELERGNAMRGGEERQLAEAQAILHLSEAEAWKLLHSSIR